MCLLTKKKLPSISLKPITCYKVVCAYSNTKDGETKTYYTPYYSAPISDKQISGKVLFKPYGKPGEPRVFCCDNDKKIYSIGQGYIHTLRNKNQAQNELMRTVACTRHAELYECVIPPFTLFYKSYDPNAFDDIASRKIRFKKKIYSI